MVDNLASSPQRRRRNQISFVRVACYVLVIVISITFCRIAYNIFSLIYYGPKPLHYYEGPLANNGFEDPPYLLPLIEDSTTFDIAATVWLRATEGEEMAHKELNPSQVNPWDDEDDDPLETPLFSDIVFRGLHMNDRVIRTNISFSVPTERFRGENLTNMDLRGTFTLIPNSPSPLDHMVDFNDYRGAYPKRNIPKLHAWAARAWPFPLGSPDREKTLKEQAIDTMSTTVGLVTFPLIPSACEETPNPRHRHEPKLGQGPAEHTKRFLDESIEQPVRLSATHGKWRKHPHIVTRTYVRIIEETHPFDMEQFLARHTDLIWSPTCGRALGRNQPWRRRCQRSYMTHGHMETQFFLYHPSVKFEDIPAVEIRYPPYLDTMPLSYGPEDEIPVPILRENCTYSEALTKSHELLAQDEATFPVTWQVTFSGRFPGQAHMEDSMALIMHKPLRYNATDLERAGDQASVEMAHGVLGHPHHHDKHPRRRFLLQLVSSLLGYLLFLLDVHYWYNLRTTAGISVFVTAQNCLLSLINTVVCSTIAQWFGEPLGWGHWLGEMLATASTLLAICAILRLEIEWSVPIRPRRMPSTHRERRSQRLDQVIMWPIKLAALFATTAVIHFLDREVRQYQIITVNNAHLAKLLTIISSAHRAAIIVKDVFQILLNRKSLTFAGAHRIVPPLLFLYCTLTVAQYHSVVIGRRNAVDVTSVVNVLDVILTGFLTWQVITLPSVDHNVDAEE